MKFYLKIHSRGNQNCIGVCDEDCLGKKYHEGNISFTVSHQFYEGNLVSKEEVLKILRHSGNYNIVGNNICEALVEEKIIHESGIKKIEGVSVAIKILL